MTGCGVRVTGCGLRVAGTHYSCEVIAESSKFVDETDLIVACCGMRGERVGIRLSAFGARL